MVKVQEATYVPNGTGGEIRASMQIGPQELTTTRALNGDERNLRPLLDQLMVKVEQVTFSSTATGGEILAQMRVGERVFVSRLAVDGGDEGLRALFDRLLDEIGRDFVRSLQSAIQQEGRTG